MTMRFNAQKVYDDMQAHIQEDKVNLNKVGNYLDRYAEVCVTWKFKENPKRLESFAVLFDANAVKIFRSVAKAAPHWDSIKSLRDSIDVPPSKGIAFTRLLVTKAGQTDAPPPKTFAESKAQDMWVKFRDKSSGSGGTSAVSVKTLQKLVERIDVSLDKKTHLHGLAELKAAVQECIKANDKPEPKPTEQPTGDLSDKLDDVALLKQQMAQMNQALQMLISQ